MQLPVFPSKPVLKLGRIVATPGALEKISGEDIRIALYRHQHGDWGNLCPEDKALNTQALKEGFRILSAYTSSRNKRFWIITEADRSATTVLLPSEY